VEGRYPNLFVASQIASASGEKARYIKNRAFDDEHYKRMILAFIKKYGSARREEIDDLLFEKLSDTLSFRQKKNKIKNLLYTLSKKDQSIKNTGTGRYPVWVLNK